MLFLRGSISIDLAQKCMLSKDWGGEMEKKGGREEKKDTKEGKHRPQGLREGLSSNFCSWNGWLPSHSSDPGPMLCPQGDCPGASPLACASLYVHQKSHDNLKVDLFGAPGWLSQSSVRLRLRS